MRNTTILLAVLAVMAVPAFAYDWDEGASTLNFSDSANWNPDGLPDTHNDFGRIGSAATGTILITSGYTAEPGNLFVGSTATVTLELQAGGAIMVDYNLIIGEGATGVGTLLQKGGAVTKSPTIRVGGYDGAATGTYNISGGSLDQGADATGTLYLGATSGSGEFIVDCSGAAGSGPSLIRVSNYDQNSDSTLEFKLDNGSGVRAITVSSSVAGNGDVDLAGEIKIADTPTTAHVVLMTYSGTLTGTFATKTLPTGWDIEYGNEAGTTHSGEMWLVPEPATMCLLGIGGLGVLLRRRRR